MTPSEGEEVGIGEKMYKIGDKIIIKDNAFAGSDQPKDFEWRGNVGEVVSDLGDGAYEVYVEGRGTCPLCDNEMTPYNLPLVHVSKAGKVKVHWVKS